jgi:hypothetical protein
MKVEAHHPNYDEPLSVEWYCPKHHRMADGRQNPDTSSGLDGIVSMNYTCTEVDK